MLPGMNHEFRVASFCEEAAHWRSFDELGPRAHDSRDSQFLLPDTRITSRMLQQGCLEILTGELLPEVISAYVQFGFQYYLVSSKQASIPATAPQYRGL